MRSTPSKTSNEIIRCLVVTAGAKPHNSAVLKSFVKLSAKVGDTTRIALGAQRRDVLRLVLGRGTPPDAARRRFRNRGGPGDQAPLASLLLRNRWEVVRARGGSLRSPFKTACLERSRHETRFPRGRPIAHKELARNFFMSHRLQGTMVCCRSIAQAAFWPTRLEDSAQGSSGNPPWLSRLPCWPCGTLPIGCRPNPKAVC